MGMVQAYNKSISKILTERFRNYNGVVSKKPLIGWAEVTMAHKSPPPEAFNAFQDTPLLCGGVVH